MPLPSTGDLCPELPRRKRWLCNCGTPMEVRCLSKGGEVFWSCPVPNCGYTFPIDQKLYWAYVKDRDEWAALQPPGGRYDEFERFEPRSGLGDEEPWGSRGRRARRPNVRLPKQSDFD